MKTLKTAKSYLKKYKDILKLHDKNSIKYSSIKQRIIELNNFINRTKK